MKKKLTVGVFLALVVVLVASIVAVDGADAARPHLIVANVNYLSNGDNTGNVTLTVSWEKYGAWSYVWLLGTKTPGALGSYDRLGGATILLNERTTSGSEVVYDESDLPCGQEYWARFYLRGKNERPIHGADDIMAVIAPCDSP